MSVSELQVYVGRLIHNILHPRKYSYFNSQIQSITTSLVNGSTSFTGKLSDTAPPNTAPIDTKIIHRITRA